MSETLSKRQHPVKRSARRPPRSAAGDAVSRLVVDVFRLNGLLIAVGDAMAEPSGQTTARWRVLAAIGEAPLTGAQIARARWLSGRARRNPEPPPGQTAPDRPGRTHRARGDPPATAHVGGVPRRRDRGGGAAP